MLTQRIGEILRWPLYKIVAGLAATGIHPNLLTFLGLLVNIWACVMFAKGRFFAAGWVMLLAGLFDMVDGRVARAQGRVTKFGAFFDSVVDRYSDLILYLGLLVYYARVDRQFYAVLVGVAMAGSVMVSYTRARAESLIPECKVGFWERPERIVLLILAALGNRMAPALWLLAIFPNITVIQRIRYTWRQMQTGNVVEVVPVLVPEAQKSLAEHIEPDQAAGEQGFAPAGTSAQTRVAVGEPAAARAGRSSGR